MRLQNLGHRRRRLLWGSWVDARQEQGQVGWGRLETWAAFYGDHVGGHLLDDCNLSEARFWIARLEACQSMATEGSSREGRRFTANVHCAGYSGGSPRGGRSRPVPESLEREARPSLERTPEGCGLRRVSPPP